ncbi:MAG: PIG-L deacetylase family protein [Actinomycetota bacterium]
MRYDDNLEFDKVMVIYAHPDDAEFGCSGTCASWAKKGVEVTYCMVTNGASGSSDPEMTREKLADMRHTEQLAAAEILGIKDVIFMGFEDGYLYPDLELRKAVAREIRKVRPDVIISQDPTNRYFMPYINHPDHIAVGEVVFRSINPDASSGLMFPELWKEEGLEPFKPKALFVMSFSEGEEFVDITDVMELKVKALETHVSQLSEWPVGEFIRERNKQIALNAKEKGRSAGEFAESFKLFRLEDF